MFFVFAFGKQLCLGVKRFVLPSLYACYKQFENNLFFHNLHSQRIYNVNFKLLSLNVRGIRSSTKRKALFLWLNKQKADIIFFQYNKSFDNVCLEWKEF